MSPQYLTSIPRLFECEKPIFYFITLRPRHETFSNSKSLDIDDKKYALAKTMREPVRLEILIPE